MCESVFMSSRLIGSVPNGKARGRARNVKVKAYVWVYCQTRAYYIADEALRSNVMSQHCLVSSINRKSRPYPSLIHTNLIRLVVPRKERVGDDSCFGAEDVELALLRVGKRAESALFPLLQRVK